MTPPSDPIHFGVLMQFDPATHTVTFTSLCGITGTDLDQFTNEAGKVRKSLGGYMTCEKCLEKIGAKTT